jgi:uncharacterized protein
VLVIADFPTRSITNSTATRQMRLNILYASLFGCYMFFCPAVNEPLFQLLAVHPTKEYIDTLRPVTMAAYTGEHKFFPVLNTREKPVFLHGVYFKAKLPAAKGTVIMNPGNAFCLTHMLGCKPALAILDLGYDLFMFDYEGFGESKGEANYKRLGNDALSAYEYVHKTMGKSHIVLYGMSMGTGVSSYVASRVPVAGVIFDSPFLSPEHTVKQWLPVLNVYPTHMFPSPHYDNEVFVVGQHPPTLIITKGLDSICSASQGIALSQRACPPTMSVVLPQSEHLYVAQTDETLYTDSLRNFLQGIPLP